MGKKQAENEKQTFFEGLHWVVFQFYTQNYFIRQNNTICQLPAFLNVIFKH